MPQVSVNLLVYGDFPDLARRCLESVLAGAAWDLIQDLRIGLNAVSATTRTYLEDRCAKVPRPVYFFVPATNVGKYPLMRRMFFDATIPPLADLVMWFDDDSYLHGADERWWQAVIASFAGPTAMIGQMSGKPMLGQQDAGVRAQPWYRGKPVHRGHRIRFLTGGWWVLRRDVLTTWNYPFPELFHNGGDTMLGELLRQQDLQLLDAPPAVKSRVAINRSKRRGLNTPPLYENYQAGQNPDLSHQLFEYRIEQPGRKDGAHKLPPVPRLFRLPSSEHV